MFVSRVFNRYLLLFPKVLEGFVNITKLRADHVEGVVDALLPWYAVLLSRFLESLRLDFPGFVAVQFILYHCLYDKRSDVLQLHHP